MPSGDDSEDPGQPTNGTVEAGPAPEPEAATDPATVPDPGTAQPAEDRGVAEQLTALRVGLARLEDRLATSSDRAEARERVIDRQHEDIERLRQAQRANHLRPVVTDLYRLRNDLLRQAATAGDMTRADVVTLLDSYAESVAEALERCGVTVLPYEIGMGLVGGRHQVAKVVDTDDPAQDGTIAQVVQDGYAELDGTIVAPARVSLYRHVTKEKTDE